VAGEERNIACEGNKISRRDGSGNNCVFPHRSLLNTQLIKHGAHTTATSHLPMMLWIGKSVSEQRKTEKCKPLKLA